METKDILTAVSDAARQGSVTERELIQAYRSGAGLPASKDHHFNLARILYVIGGIIVAAGFIFLIVQMWDDFSASAQILVSLGSAVAFYFAGTLLHTQNRLRPISLIMLVLSGILFPLGIYITLHHFSPGGDPWVGQLIISGLPALVFLGTFALIRQPLVIFLGILLGTWALYALVGLVLDDANVSPSFAGKFWYYWTMAVGMAYILLGYSSKILARQLLTGPLYLLGSAAVLISGFALSNLQETFWVPVYFLVVLGSMYAGIILKSRSFLVFGALGLIIHLTRVSFQYFADNLGWPLALIIAGLVIIAVGYATVWLNNRYVSRQSSSIGE